MNGHGQGYAQTGKHIRSGADSLHECGYHLHGILVITAFRDYQISILLGRLYKAEMPGTHNIRILPYDALYSPAALCYIPLKPSYEADIRRSIHIELQIEQIPYALIL